MLGHSVVAEIRIEPIGSDGSMKDEVDRAVQSLRDQGLKLEVGPMGTTVQADSLDEILAGVKAAHEAACKSSPRVVTELVVDERMDKDEPRLDEA